MRKQMEHRIRGTAAWARPGWAWAAALAMNAPAVLACALVGWFAISADEPALAALAGVLFAMALLWTVFATLESWRVLRRFTRRRSRTTSSC
jgi:hypothetical protein